jgi:hypothetical protein
MSSADLGVNCGPKFGDDMCVAPTAPYCHYKQIPNINDRHQSSVGLFTGTCQCPDGQTYLVGDNKNFCQSLACYGGKTIGCELTFNTEQVYGKVTCGQDIGICEKTPPPQPESLTQNIFSLYHRDEIHMECLCTWFHRPKSNIPGPNDCGPLNFHSFCNDPAYPYCDHLEKGFCSSQPNQSSSEPMYDYGNIPNECKDFGIPETIIGRGIGRAAETVFSPDTNLSDHEFSRWDFFLKDVDPNDDKYIISSKDLS